MPVPQHHAKAALFKTLGHPVRVQVLELLCDGPKAVRDLLITIDVEASNLSQQLAVLRQAGIVTARREGSTVTYRLAGGDVPELMRAARRVLNELKAGHTALLAELTATPPPGAGV